MIEGRVEEPNRASFRAFSDGDSIGSVLRAQLMISVCWDMLASGRAESSGVIGWGQESVLKHDIHHDWSRPPPRQRILRGNCCTLTAGLSVAAPSVFRLRDDHRSCGIFNTYDAFHYGDAMITTVLIIECSGGGSHVKSFQVTLHADAGPLQTGCACSRRSRGSPRTSSARAGGPNTTSPSFSTYRRKRSVGNSAAWAARVS